MTTPPDDTTTPVTAEYLTSPAVVGPAHAAVYEVIRKLPGTAERNAVIWRAVQAYQAALMVDPDTGRHPLDALIEVRCGHERHQWMCVNCAADAMRPEVERLRAELAEAREAYLAVIEAAELRGTVRTLQAERDALKAALERALACHARDDSNPRGPWCNTCLTVWPCATARALGTESHEDAAATRPKLITGNGMKRRPSEELILIHEDPDEGSNDA